MTRTSIAALILIFGLGNAQAEELVWQTDLALARAQAAEEGRPLLVVFR